MKLFFSGLVPALLVCFCAWASGCDEDQKQELACDRGVWFPVVETGEYAVVCSQQGIDDLAGYTAIDGVNVVIGFRTEEDYEALYCPGGGEHITSLASLSCLQTVEGALAISHLDFLESLEGLESLTYLVEGHFGWDLKVTDNPLLPTCEAEQLVAQLQAAGWQGTPLIENNNDAATCE
jgi:hypothetical protein